MTEAVPGTYALDSEALKLNAYRLLCLFYANKEIARLCDPESPADAAVQLERRFFSREMTHLLLNIAIGLRVLDDQMLALPPGNANRQKYLVQRDRVNQRYQCMMFDEMPLREVCNKVIHALVVDPHSTEGSGSHRIDEYNWLAWSDVHDVSPEEAGQSPIQSSGSICRDTSDWVAPWVRSNGGICWKYRRSWTRCMSCSTPNPSIRRTFFGKLPPSPPPRRLPLMSNDRRLSSPCRKHHCHIKNERCPSCRLGSPNTSANQSIRKNS